MSRLLKALDDKGIVLIFSPQGLEAEGDKYQKYFPIRLFSR